MTFLNNPEVHLTGFQNLSDVGALNVNRTYMRIGVICTPSINYQDKEECVIDFNGNIAFDAVILFTSVKP